MNNIYFYSVAAGTYPLSIAAGMQVFRTTGSVVAGVGVGLLSCFLSLTGAVALFSWLDGR